MLAAPHAPTNTTPIATIASALAVRINSRRSVPGCTTCAFEPKPTPGFETVYETEGY
jgi:hypothetical protein